MRTKKLIQFSLSIVLAISLLAGCAGKENGTSENTTTDSSGSTKESTPDVAETNGDIQDDDTLVVALNAEPPTLDPLMSTGGIVRDCNKNIFEGLFEMDENYEPKPQLISNFDVNDDYTEYTFYLREGVKFHNGETMDSSDVVASLNRWLDKNSAVKSVITEGEKFESVNDNTVKITLNSPCYLLPSIMCAPAQFPAIMPTEVIEAATEDGGIQEYIGTGPCKFQDWKQGSYLELVKNEDYVGPGYPLTGEAGDKAIHFKMITMNFVPDATVRTSGLISGEYDIVSNINYDDVEMLSTYDNITLDKSLMGYSAVILNKAEGILADNEKLREAVTLALDPDEIMASAYPAEGYTNVSASMMPEGSKWYTLEGADEINTDDLEKAKEVLAESGYNGEEIRVVTDETYMQHYNATLVMVDELQKLGLNVKMDVVDWTTMLQYKQTPSTYDLYFMDYPAVTSPLSLRTISQTDEGFTTWPEFLDLLSKVNLSKSDEEAAVSWQESQKYLLTRFSFVPLGYSYYCNGTTNDMEGYHSISCQNIFGAYRAQ